MLVVSLCLTLTLAAQVPNQNDAEFQKKIAEARKGAIDYLKREQNKDGNWEDIVVGVFAEMEGGKTALVTLALLEGGVPASDPAIAKAVDYLVKLPPKKTYVVSLQTQVLARVDPKKHKEQIQKNADWLIEKALKKNGELNGWSYPGHDIGDGSNTHFAVTGLHAAAQAEAKLNGNLWKQIKELYVRTQIKDGWSYYHNQVQIKDPATTTMTACALCGLLIASKNGSDAKLPEEAFEKGMKLILEWDLKSRKSTAYAMMVVSELGKLQGSQEMKMGEKTWAWYKIGAEQLIKIKTANGSFVFDEQSSAVDKMPVLSTAFGLYFLGPPTKK